MRAALVALVALVAVVALVVIDALGAAACHRAEPPSATLAELLTSVTTVDAATRERIVHAWKLDRETWQRVTTDPYRDLYADYARAFDAAEPILVTRVSHPGTIAVRPHFAGDPKLTLGQARARWAEPVQAPSEIAEIDGAPIDAVFVHEGTRWHVIVGIDAILRTHASAFDRGCAALLERTTSKLCDDALWVVAEAALRGDRARFDHGCALAANACRR